MLDYNEDCLEFQNHDKARLLKHCAAYAGCGIIITAALLSRIDTVQNKLSEAFTTFGEMIGDNLNYILIASSCSVVILAMIALYCKTKEPLNTCINIEPKAKIMPVHISEGHFLE